MVSFFGSKRNTRIRKMSFSDLMSKAMEYDQSCAYLVQENVGKILLIPSMWSDRTEPTYRIMKETIGNLWQWHSIVNLHYSMNCYLL